jgi:hypothetical protein
MALGLWLLWQGAQPAWLRARVPAVGAALDRRSRSACTGGGRPPVAAA